MPIPNLTNRMKFSCTEPGGHIGDGRLLGWGMMEGNGDEKKRARKRTGCSKKGKYEYGRAGSLPPLLLFGMGCGHIILQLWFGGMGLNESGGCIVLGCLDFRHSVATGICGMMFGVCCRLLGSGLLVMGMDKYALMTRDAGW
ncbi:MAG: hypothetical protein JOS17DRAFT_121354 [Linnemannia elongata]|nr:MAG: hypothetical protein JOS17DRAFT_121354 [Linnemannia elongata]